MISKSRKDRIFFVIPSFNEGSVIRKAVQPLVDAGYSVVVVDDGSRDETKEQLKGSGAHYVRHPVNLGQGAALQTGMDYALARGAEYIAHFDADGQHQLEDVERLLELVMAGEADVALGSRFMRREDWEAVPFGRRLLLRGGVIVNGLLTGMWLSDAANGERALSRAAVEKIDLKENGFAHATEILHQIKSAGLRYVENPTRIHYTEYSSLKGGRVTSLSAVEMFLDMLIRRFIR